MHIHLRVGETSGKPAFESVHVLSLGGRRYRIEFTPGLAYGVAAGDEVELADDGTYHVLARAGNIAVRVLSEQPLSSVEPELTAHVASSLGGRLDGSVSRGLAYTIPLKTGFSAIEGIFNKFVSTTRPASKARALALTPTCGLTVPSSGPAFGRPLKSNVRPQ